MTRKLQPGRLVIASHNEGKVREIRALLEPYGIEPISAGSLGLPEPEETGTTFVDNAELKALASAEASGIVALSDDSGLCVDALGGDPGIYTARWGERTDGTRDFAAGMQRVETELAAKGPGAPRTAHFICALSLAWPDGHVESFEGRIDGSLVWPPRGDLGHGYDPVFVADGHSETFGEMDQDEKNAISHRAHAFRQLVAALF